MFGSLIAGPCTATVPQIYSRGRRLHPKNSFNKIIGRFTFCVCFRENEIMAETAVLLTEMTCESPKSKFLQKNMAAFLPNNMAVLTKIAPRGEAGR